MEKSELIENLRKQYFSEKILKAFEKVPREKFVQEQLKQFSYEDIALPLEEDATISQPYTIAFMLNLMELKKGQKILEIGSGSGYVLALLSEITNGEIYGVEIIKSLTEKSKQILNESGYKKIKIYNKNGYEGLKEKSPFDRILISATSDKIPEHLISQLKNNGIIVAPVGNSILQIKKENEKIKIKKFEGFIFVPLKK